jgi:hypothetical protein
MNFTVQQPRRSPLHQLFSASSPALTLILCLTVTQLTACGSARWQETHPQTGDPFAENQFAPRPVRQSPPGAPGYVVPDRLRGRSNPDQPGDQSTVILERNDRVKIIDPTPKGKDGLIKVVVVDTQGPAKPPGPIYVDPRYVNEDPVQPEPQLAAADRYFVIQNIATEKLRVYENCGGRDCRHRLVLETDLVVGEDTRTRRSHLGSYRITEWFKFYEDNRSLFPSWFHPSYPALPAPGADLQAWGSQSLLPANGPGLVRGSFGWYTAHLGPNAAEQWTHGTWGWGADGDKFIRLIQTHPHSRNPQFSSRGCTRVENQAIAFMREILPVGTKIIKVYAREALAANVTALRPLRWDWILTTEGVDVNGPSSDKDRVLSRNVVRQDILESGSFLANRTPSVVPLRPGQRREQGFNGNVYNINESAFQGHFLVDEGRLVNYRHPVGLEVGGHRDGLLPSVVLK